MIFGNILQKCNSCDEMVDGCLLGKRRVNSKGIGRILCHKIW